MKTDDTAKVNTLNEITRAYLFELNDVHKLLEYGKLQLLLAQKLNYKKGIAYGLLNLGLYHWQTGNHAAAMDHYRKSLKLMKETGNKKGESSCYQNMGLIYSEKGRYKEALEYLFRGVTIKEAIKDVKGTGIGYNNIGNIFFDQGDYTQSLKYYLKSLKIKEELNDKIGGSMTSNNIGNIFLNQGKLDIALVYFNNAEKMQQGIADKQGLGFTLTNIGSIYEKKNQYAKALGYHLKALEARESVGDKVGMAESNSGLGNIYFNLKNMQQAFSYYLRSVQISEEIGYKKGLLGAYGGLGNVFEEKKDFKKALMYYDKMLDLATELNNKEGIRNAYINYASVYRKLKQFDSALKYTELYNEVKDSLLNKENFKQVAELNTRYETDKKEKDILLLTKDQQLNNMIINQQKIVRWGLIAGIVLLSISVFSIFRRYRYKQKANLLLESQKKEIQQKNILINDSIDYARTIQEAVLPTEDKMLALFPEHFVLYKPKAIVSGDFYWVHQTGQQLICAVADCTGHGVPGAFMSLMGYNMLENVVKNNDWIQPSLILDELNAAVVTRFPGADKEGAVKHGMDIACITIDGTTGMLEYAGAHNSLYVVRDGELMELKATKRGIGFVDNEKQFHYENLRMKLKRGDMLYLYTDGFPDQIGGPKRKKFYYTPFKELLRAISTLPLPEQQKKLEQAHVEWLAEKYDQTDDILICGIKYS